MTLKMNEWDRARLEDEYIKVKGQRDLLVRVARAVNHHAIDGALDAMKLTAKFWDLMSRMNKERET